MIWSTLSLLVHSGILMNKEIAVLIDNNLNDMEYAFARGYNFSVELNVDTSFSSSCEIVAQKCKNFCDIVYFIVESSSASTTQNSSLQTIFSHFKPLSKQCIFLVYSYGSELSSEIVLNSLNDTFLSHKLIITSCVYIMIGNNLYELYYLKEFRIFNPVNLNKHKYPSRTGRRKDFYLTPMNCGHVRMWSNYSSNGAETIQLSNSMTYIYLAYMQDFLHFGINFVANKDWKSMANQVKTGEIDLGISATGMTLSAARDFRFLTIPTYLEKLTAYYRLPDDESVPTVFLHTKPFSPSTWYVTFIVVGLILLSHFKLTKNLHTSLWYIVCCATLHGFGTGGPKNSIRIVTFIGSLLFVILNASYSGELISSLSTKKEKSYSIKDLLDLGFTFGIRNDSYLAASKNLGEFAENSLAGRMFSQLNKGNVGQPNILQGINGIFSTINYALITEENVFEVVNTGINSSKINPLQSNNETVCKLFRYVPIPEYTVQQSPITIRNSPYVGYFNFARAQMKETGIWYALSKGREVRTNLLKPQCSLSPTRPFFINDVLLPLCIVWAGIILSCQVLIIEKILLSSNKSDLLQEYMKWNENEYSSSTKWQFDSDRKLVLLPELYLRK